MRYNFVKFGITANLELNEERQDYPFFEQNREKFAQLFEFLSGSKDCFVMSGFQGVGKSKILDEALTYLNEDVLLFRYNMYEATTIDDILLNMTIDFRDLLKGSQTQLPKIDTKDFRERIQYYVKSIEKPMLLVLESYENVLKFEDTSSVINDFLLHIASIAKFKIIFVCRNMDSQIFQDKNIGYDKTIITSLDEELVSQYFDRYNLKTTPESISELISCSRCYLKYIDMTIKALQTFNLSLDELITEYKLKNTSYSNFLISKFMALIPDKSRELIYILTLIRQGVTPEFLTLINKNNPSEISYLKNILILNEYKNTIYIKDYFKRELEKEIDQFSTLKLHSFLESVYDNMLPQKTFERALPISRNTMHREKAYHAKFIENYQLSGMRAETGIKFSSLRSKAETKEETKEIQPSQPTPNESPIIENINLEAELKTRRKTPRVNPAQTLSDYIKLASKYKHEFDYTTAIFYYQKALDKKQDPTFELHSPNILANLAHCYTKTQKHDKAIQCLNLAYEIHFKQKQFDKANDIMLDLAIEHKNNYKLTTAKSCIEKILTAPILGSSELMAKTYTLLADIEDLSSNLTKAKELYKKGLDEALKTSNKELICTAYFKYGLLLDDTNQQTQAIECYKKCIDTCQNPNENHFLSSAYTNLAGIQYERENITAATIYYQKALDADKLTNNHEGIYFVYKKLAEIYENSDRQTSYKYLLNSLQAAKRLGDKLYIADIYLEIGDYYYRQNANTQAIKAYLSAKHFTNNDTDLENKHKIEIRLKDLKIKLGEQKYNLTAEGFRYNDENPTS